MKIRDFKIERFFAKYEFSAPYLMGSSDCESFTVQEILDLEPGSEEKLKKYWLGYTESQGDPELRKEIAKLYKKVDAEGILVHSGAEEAIFIFMNVSLKPGDHVIVQYPCYQSLFEVANAIGCEVTKWELKQGEKGWELDLEELKRAVKDNTKAIVINTPHNPTGYLLSQSEINEIIGIAREKNLRIFSDEVYRYLEYNTSDRIPSTCDLYENAVSLGVMSKSYGLPGLRIGWIATQSRGIYREMASFKDYTTICNSAPSEFLSLLALRHGDKILKREMEIIKNNLVLLDDFFGKYRDIFTWNRPKAGPIAFPKFNKDVNAEEIVEDMVAKKGVFYVPGSMYGFDVRYFRIGYGRKNLGDCLKLFEEYVRENLV